MQQNNNTADPCAAAIGWAASWTDISARVPRSDALRDLCILRGVTRNLVYLALARHLAELESDDGRSVFGRVWRWSHDLVVGCGPRRPPWPHAVVMADQLAPLHRPFAEYGVMLSDDARREAFVALLQYRHMAVAWREWSRLVLALYDRERRIEPCLAPRSLENRLALADLEEAIDRRMPSIAAMALARLGWPLPWSPPVDQ